MIRRVARQVHDRHAENGFDIRIERRRATNAFERGSRLRLPKTERPKAPKRLFVGSGGAWIDSTSVGRAIGMSEVEPRRHAPLDSKLPAMQSTMMRAA